MWTMKEAILGLHQSGRIDLDEPCNCGDQIRHNNGGNYHQWVVIDYDKDTYYLQIGDTCGLTENELPKEINISDVVKVIRDCQKDNYALDYKTLDKSDDNAIRHIIGLAKIYDLNVSK